MIFIAHRRNTILDLENTPTEYGVEVDIRSNNGSLIIQHEPLAPGEEFRAWLKHYRHGTLILNVKEEGLEAPLIELMNEHSIRDYFFLDQSFPFLIKWAALGERRCAVRISEFESLETALKLSGKIDWVWVDCFNHFPLTGNDAKRLQDHGFKLCLVSPELQGRPAQIGIPEMADILQMRSIKPEAICTKNPTLWQESLKKLN